jgi:hypothetical protein
VNCAQKFQSSPPTLSTFSRSVLFEILETFLVMQMIFYLKIVGMGEAMMLGKNGFVELGA